MRLSKTDRQFYVDLFERYAAAHPDAERIEASHVIEWAKGLQLSPDQIRAIHVARLSESLRSKTVKDGEGRRVRLYHCVESKDDAAEDGPKQKFFWAHVDEATESFLAISLEQRRQKIGRDVESIRADVAYIVARRKPRTARLRKAVQMSFDFSEAAV